MKDDPALRRVPIARAQRLGGCFYVAKPFKGRELLDLLDRVLNGSQSCPLANS
jgi:DNA-binding response OmpR family regulator